MIAEHRIARVMAETGMDYIQARNNLQQRDILAARLRRPSFASRPRGPYVPRIVR